MATPAALRLQAEKITRVRTLDLRDLPFRKQPAVTRILDEVNKENEFTASLLRAAAIELELLRSKTETWCVIQDLDGKCYMHRESLQTNCPKVAVGMTEQQAYQLVQTLHKYAPKEG